MRSLPPIPWTPLKTLVLREAWEYRDWWTSIFAVCVLAGCGFILATQIQHSHPDPEVNAGQVMITLRWCMGFFLGGAGILAMSHAAHGVFDERQDGSISFWQSWPVSEKTRLIAKSIAISFGWPLLAGAASLIVWLFSFCLVGIQSGGIAFIAPSLSFLGTLLMACVLSAAWAWPITCLWLWCSSVASKSPWLWAWALGTALAGIGILFHLPLLPMAATIILGPAYGFFVQATGMDMSLLPWVPGSLSWCLICLLGGLSILHAARQLRLNGRD